MKKLYLSETDKKLCGVCGGIGEAMDVDPTLVRLVFVAAAVCTAILPMTLFYIIAWAIVPERPKD